MTDHPLRPVTRLSLGRPLPYQLADGPQTDLSARGFRRNPPLCPYVFRLMALVGISSGFPELFQTERYVIHVLLTRPPLYSSSEDNFRARLACVRHAASVRSEPGSNSPIKLGFIYFLTRTSRQLKMWKFLILACYSVVKDPFSRCRDRCAAAYRETDGQGQSKK